MSQNTAPIASERCTIVKLPELICDQTKQALLAEEEKRSNKAERGKIPPVDIALELIILTMIALVVKYVSIKSRDCPRMSPI